jgi:putative redox protein
MKAKVVWQGGMKFDGTADSGHHVPLSAKMTEGGDGSGFTPMELIAIGLAGCTALDVIAILRKKRQDVTDFEVQVRAERAAEHPKVFTRAVIDYTLAGHGIDEVAVLRSIELSATRYCPAHAMFHEVFPIGMLYHVYEVDLDGSRRLVTSGEYSVD